MKDKKRLVAGVLCAVVAAVMMLTYVSNVRAEALSSREDAIARYGGETVDVCVATRDVAAGEVLTGADVRRTTWVVDLLPAESLTDESDVIGQTALSPILANEPYSRSKIGNPSASITVPDGLCAVTVPSKDEQAVGGAIRSGSLVNVYAADQSSVHLLGQNILVLETSGSGSAGDGSNPTFGNASARSSVSWVTLAVTPESVSELIAASKSQTLYFALPGGSGAAPSDSQDDSRASSDEPGSTREGEDQ